MHEGAATFLYGHGQRLGPLFMCVATAFSIDSKLAVFTSEPTQRARVHTSRLARRSVRVKDCSACACKPVQAA